MKFGPQPPFILLAEDDDNDAFGIHLAFQKAGIADKVRRVSDGEQTIDYLGGIGKYADRNQFPLPSVLLIDWDLPGKSGAQILEWVRAHPTWRHLVTVVLTGSLRPHYMRRAYELGANSYLAKPCSFVDFVRTLELLGGYWQLNHVPQPSSQIG